MGDTELDFYASARCSVAGGILFCPVHASMCASQNIVNVIPFSVFVTFSPNLHE